MKKQVVAILIALVVISGLLTVSVLSEEAYKPIIQAVTVSPTEIVNGGVVTFTVTAKSNAPVKCVGYKEGDTNCTEGTCCSNVGDELWKCEWTRKISEWAPAATYTYSHIYVINEGELRSEEWPYSISFNVGHSVPTPPEGEGFGGDNLSLCDAIVISLGNATVTDFLNATNMTTVQVSNFKGYKGENTLRVQWSFSNRSLDVYLNETTGNIVGIGEKTALTPTPAPTPTAAPAPTPTPTPTPTPAPASTPAPAPASEPKTWHFVDRFEDSKNMRTPSFTIKGDMWRIDYIVNPLEGLTDDSTFKAYVYPDINETAFNIGSLGCMLKQCAGTKEISKGNADYYIDVKAAYNHWELEVKDFY